MDDGDDEDEDGQNEGGQNEIEEEDEDGDSVDEDKSGPPQAIVRTRTSGVSHNEPQRGWTPVQGHLVRLIIFLLFFQIFSH